MTGNNESPTSRVSVWTLKEIAQAVPLLAIGLTTTCFVLGLVILNIYLAKYGVYPSAFVRSEFILIGVVFIFFVAVTRILVEYILPSTEKISSLWKEKKYFKLLVEIFLGISMSALLTAGILSNFSLNSNDWSFKDMSLSIPILFLLGELFKTTFIRIVSLAQGLSIEQPKKSPLLLSQMHDLLVSIPLIILFVSFYAYFTYPHVSSALGGGYRSQVVLTPTARGLEVSQSLALPLQNNQTMVGPIKVLTENEKEFVVLIPDTLTGKWRTVRLNRELFDAVQTAASTL